MRPRLARAALAALASCFDPTLGEGFGCDDGSCPGGFQCCPDEVCRESCQGTVGIACEDVSVCGGGGFCLDFWEGGYCLGSCGAEGTCPAGSQCERLDGTEDQGACFDSCDGASDCRDGYQCNSRGFCSPEPSEGTTGDVCRAHDECPGGFCTATETMPVGACTQICFEDEDCADDSRCVSLADDRGQRFTICLPCERGRCPGR